MFNVRIIQPTLLSGSQEHSCEQEDGVSRTKREVDLKHEHTGLQIV